MAGRTSEFGYTPAMSSSDDHEVHKEHAVALGKKYLSNFVCMLLAILGRRKKETI